MSWSISASSFVTAYDIYTAQSSGGPYIKIASMAGQQISYTVQGLITDTTFFFVVRAENNGKESDTSNEVWAKPIFPKPPQTPMNLAAHPGNTIVTLTWQKADGALGYKISDCTNSTLFTSTAGTAVQIAGLVNGTQYCFVVKAFNDAGESGPSNQVFTSPVASAPLAPTVTQAVISGTSITLTWTTVPSAESYNIYSGTTSGHYFFLIETIGTTYTMTGLTPGMDYYFVVTARNAFGESAYSRNSHAANYDETPDELEDRLKREQCRPRDRYCQISISSYADLNDDGIDEVIVVDGCGANNCSSSIYQKKDGKYVAIGSLFGTYEVLQEKTNGYYDISTAGHISAYQSPGEVLIWDGAKYVDRDWYADQLFNAGKKLEAIELWKKRIDMGGCAVKYSDIESLHLEGICLVAALLDGGKIDEAINEYKNLLTGCRKCAKGSIPTKRIPSNKEKINLAGLLEKFERYSEAAEIYKEVCPIECKGIVEELLSKQK